MNDPKCSLITIGLLALVVAACSATQDRSESLSTPLAEKPAPPNLDDNVGLALGDSYTRFSDGMIVLYVPSDEFVMGSDEEEVEYALNLCRSYDTNCSHRYFAIEQPQHIVQLSSYWIDKTEVSTSRYQQCVDAGVCSESSCDDMEDLVDNDQPIVCVTWDQAASYCGWVEARLPTEAEWEYAARGPDGGRYPWGDEIDGRRLNYCDVNCELDKRNDAVDDGFARSAPVGSYPDGASWIGALDLAGNVWEWTADYYGPYLSEQQSNPTGPDTGDRRIARGGSWHTSADHARSALRTYSQPDRSINHVGFRCAASQS